MSTKLTTRLGEDKQCNCVVKNRDEGETQREWLKRVMCMFHWMQTDYYRDKGTK
jgi:hypothetical protein